VCARFNTPRLLTHEATLPPRGSRVSRGRHQVRQPPTKPGTVAQTIAHPGSIHQKTLHSRHSSQASGLVSKTVTRHSAGNVSSQRLLPRLLPLSSVKLSRGENRLARLRGLAGTLRDGPYRNRTCDLGIKRRPLGPRPVSV